jgi:ubiquinone/menaquinone biosynthesis C-methylase UbiE
MDEYETDVHRWWHRETPSPELLDALADGWLVGDTVLDVGCGLGTEAGEFADRAWTAVGIDLSMVALRRASAAHPAARFLRADVRRLPFAAGTFDVALDRGCFHYLESDDRPRYVAEVRRVLASKGRLLLRACTTSEGQPNGIDEKTIASAFEGWRIASAQTGTIPSDTRQMPAVIARLERAD